MNKDKFNILNYKDFYDNYDSNQINILAKDISKVNREIIENSLFENLFQKNNENLDALIIKILFFTKSWGVEALLDFILKNPSLKLTKYNYNVIGKYVTNDLEYSWNIIKKYIGILECNNLKYAITRTIYYISKLDSDSLKNTLNYEEIRELYINKELHEKYNLPKIDDSIYIDNQSEFEYSLHRIIKKLSKVKLVGNEYITKYNNTIFQGDAYIERIFERVRKEFNIPSQYRKKNYCILSEYGNNILGKKLLDLEELYRKIVLSDTNTEYNKWLNKYTTLIYDTVIEYGENNFEKMFESGSGWLKEILFRCNINDINNTNKALKIINKLRDNNYKILTNIEIEVLEKLIESLNIEAINIFYNRLKKEIDSELRIGNFTFNFQMGICKKYYGSYEMAKFAYSTKRQMAGHYWEQVVGSILKTIFEDFTIKKHPVLDNNTIPDYVIYNELEKKSIIVECKLTLGIEEILKTVKKYSNYSKEIYFFCFKNRLNNNILESEELLEINKNYKIDIFDYDKISSLIEFDNKENFKQFVSKISQKNVLAMELFLDKQYTIYEKNLLTETLNMTWGSSTLFSSRKK